MNDLCKGKSGWSYCDGSAYLIDAWDGYHNSEPYINK
jgi:hypothetical protein